MSNPWFNALAMLSYACGILHGFVFGMIFERTVMELIRKYFKRKAGL